MSQKVVLITGCSRGLGLGLVAEYASRGFRVIATCRDPGSAPRLKELLTSTGQPAALALDVTSVESISDCKKAVENKVSGHIDILVNNGGISNRDHPDDPVAKVDPDEFNNVHTVNVTGPLSVTNAFLPMLKKAKQPKVVNISSTLGSLEASPRYTTTSYQCSKASLNMLTKCYAFQERNVIFLAVHPGWLQTDMGSSKDRKPPVTISESAKGIANVVDNRTVDDSGCFWSFEGSKVPF